MKAIRNPLSKDTPSYTEKKVPYRAKMVSQRKIRVPNRKKRFHEMYETFKSSEFGNKF